MSRFSCYIITDSTLGIQCAEHLLQKKHKIYGVLSQNPLVSAWCKNHDIPLIDSLQTFEALAIQKNFDYLFSIVNPKILSSKILSSSQKLAINYHDAPLPRYAGTHATSWAILNQEKTHGVTWHRMEPKVDAGDILKQEIIPIDKGETALSLNIKCYLIAIKTFKALCDDLSQGTVLRVPQDLTKRTFFGTYKKPFSLGFVNWKESGDQIETLFRALSFGDYPNALSSFKILFSSDYFCPKSLKILYKNEGNMPGTILKVSEKDNLIEIASLDYVIELKDFVDSKKTSWPIGKILKDQKLKKDSLLKNPSKSFFENYKKVSQLLSPHEEYWRKKLQNTHPIDLSSFLREEIPKTSEKVISTEVKASLSKELWDRRNKNLKSHSFEEILVSTFLIYFRRIMGESQLTVGISPQDYRSHREFYVNDSLPLNTYINPFQTALPFIKENQKELEEVEHHRNFASDIKIRYPDLKDKPLDWNVIFKKENSHKRRSFYEKEPALQIEFKQAELSFSLTSNHILKEKLESLSIHITHLLKQVLENPERLIAELELLTPQEKDQLLIEWNATEKEYEKDKTIYQLFEEQVERTPNNVAVIFEEEELTYRELNEKANQLAHLLREEGVTPDTLVAIGVERSFEMIIGLLGILKAGGAYVPLDPEYPQERLLYMLQDTKAPLLLTQEGLEERFKGYKEKILSLSLKEEELWVKEDSKPQGHKKSNSSQDLWVSLGKRPSSNLPSLTLPHHLAYVIYTSGSTGKSKGTLIPHQNIVRLLKATEEWYHFNSQDVWTFFHSYAFDFSIWEIWGALSYGSKLVIIPYLTSRSPENFFHLLVKHNVTILNQTPSAFEQLLLHNPSLASSSDIRFVIFGGEALEVNKLKPWFKSNNKEGFGQLINMYGITETTVHVTYLSIKEKDTEKPSNHIGKRLPDLNIYLLDEHMSPVPVGVKGEIYIGGAGLARGYLNRPNLTAEKFVPNPFMTEQDTRKTSKSLRLYRTGDVARYLSDGNIEFLGRIDDQVKLRGFRIELGEIESTLSSHRDVASTVVMAREDEEGSKKLVAYVVPEDISSLSLETSLSSSSGDAFHTLKGEEVASLTESLRNHLTRSLPDYMVPSFFVYLDALPLTSNGKIDRKGLPAPDLSLRLGVYVAPQTETELALASIWSEVLRVPEVSMNDNFFRIGGHSLLATQVISRVRESFSIDIPLRTLFEHPTIADLALEIEGKETLSVLPPILPQERTAPLPLSFAQQRLWFLGQLIPDVALYNIPLTLKLKGPLNLNALEKAFNDLIRRHESLRTTFSSKEGNSYQVILPHLKISLKEALVDLEKDLLLQDILYQETNKPFNLESGPLIRLKVIRLAVEEHILLLTLHHIISDGWSMGVLSRELSCLYNSYLHGESPQLPDLTIQYADFALWQRTWLQGDILESQLSYWKEELEGIPDVIDCK